MFTYKIKHAPSGLEEIVVAGSVHYGTGTEWVKFYAEPQPNREYNPVYAIRADVVGSINRVSASTFLFRMTRSSRVEVNTGSSDGYHIFICKDDKNLTVNIPTAYWESVGKPNEFSMVLEPKDSSLVSKSTTDFNADVKAFEADDKALLEEGIVQDAKDKTLSDRLVTRAQIKVQLGEISRLQAELSAKQDSVSHAAGIIFRGNFDPKHSYFMNNLVSYQMKLYLALKNVPPGELPTNTKYWEPTESMTTTRDAGSSETITYVVNGEPLTTTEQKLSVRAMITTAGYTPVENYRLASASNNYVYDDYDQKILLRNGENFTVTFLGNTPVA
jgi:uncharacterized small protein (DUF1192 family)